MPDFVKEDDDIEFLYETTPLNCLVCATSLHKLSPKQRQIHYERHFTDEPQASGSGSSKPPSTAHNTPVKLKPGSRPARPDGGKLPMKQNVFWTQAHLTAPPSNFTPGLIPTLKRALLKTHAKGLTTRAMLCHEGVTHVASESWDRGWGCGYRNFLMACTGLVNQTVQPLYFPLLDHPSPPGVRNLQTWIEDAWADGFDREGATQLKHNLVGTRKWIGAAELYVAFVSRGIPARLVDFPGSERGPKALTDWVMNYFSPPILNKGKTDAFNALKGASPVSCTECMPLILQHAGHSRTVVGIEVNKKGDTNLLIFDPSIRPNAQLRSAAIANYPSLSSPSKTKSDSPSILQRVLHPHRNKNNSKDRKRRASNTVLDEAGREVKRVRGGVQLPAGNDDAVTISDDSDDDVPSIAENLDPVTVVNFFRVNQSKLKKNDKYQILWFPLDPPLEEHERWERRVVTSERVV